MEVLKSKILRFSIIFLVAIFATDRMGALLLDNLYSDTRSGFSGGRINYFLQMEKTPEITVMGNSRSFYQVIPDSFETSTFNLSHAGMDDAFQLGLLSILIKEKKAPKTLLLNIDTHYYLGEATSKPFVSMDIQHLKYYYGKDETVTENINAISQFEFIKYWFHLYSYNGKFLNILKNYLQVKLVGEGMKPIPYGLVEPTLNDSIVTITTSKDTPFKEMRYLPNRTRYLKDMIDLCKQNNIRLICFTSPYFFFDMQDLDEAREQISDLLEKNDVKYLDYTTITIPELQNPWLWKDVYHVNRIGAGFFSKDLAERIGIN